MSIRKIEFEGHDGVTLAARLDMPIGKPRACALFAHCFTCSKDIAAARAVSQTLADLGIAVLRFDFTGLGHSQGEFSNSNFSSNVADLIAAADYMRRELQAPAILIGHSLGGAAVIAAAGKVPESKAVVVIGAPSDPEHVLKAMGGSIDEIRDAGSAVVDLAGRPFTITKQFVEDISQHNLNEALAKLGKALLVLHAPLDATVGIENAGELFKAARHPKSFVTLDDADHLLSRKEDAEYAAHVIAAWVKRYLPAAPESEAGAPEGTVRVTESDSGGLLQHISIDGRFELLADEPRSVGGSNLGPTPYHYLSAALGACTSMTLRMYARRKSIAMTGVRVDVVHSKSHAEDAGEAGAGGAGGKARKVDVFERSITIEGELSQEERQRLLQIADLCPVHKTLEAQVTIRTTLEEE
jgi:putative redox protein